LIADVRRWPFVFLAVAVLAPPLPLPWGDSGVHLAPLIALIGLWAGLRRPADWIFRADTRALALILFTGALALSAPFAWLYSGGELAAASLARAGLIAISVYLFLYLAYGPGRHIAPESLIRLIFVTGWLSAAFAVIDFYFQFPAPARFAEQFVWLNSGVYRRAQGVFYEASTLGLLCVFLLVMAAAAIATRSTDQLKLSRAQLAAASTTFLAALIFSFSRAAVVNLAASLIVLWWFSRLQHGRADRTFRLAVAAALSAAAAAGLAIYLFADYVAAYTERLRQSAEFLFSEPNMVLSRRLESWDLLLRFIEQDPWCLIWGIGYKTLPYAEFMGRPIIADNMYLSLLIETGISGLAALLFLCGVVLVFSYSQARTAASPTLRLCGTWVFCFWTGLMLQMASGDILTYWRLLPLYFTVLAIGARHDDPVPGPVQ
jgi:O-antigen ligase